MDVYRQWSSSKLSQVTLQLVLCEQVVSLFNKHVALGEIIASPLAAEKDIRAEKLVFLHTQWHVVSFVLLHDTSTEACLNDK